MPPKGVSKAVSKKCPECKKPIPVATRHCMCGYQFFEERRRSTTSNTSEQDEPEDPNASLAMQEMKIRGLYAMEGQIPQPGSSGSPAVEVKRRSERVKREKPNFYDALEYDNQMRKARKERQKEEQMQHHSSGRIKRERKIKLSSEHEDDEDDELLKEKGKRKKKKSTNGGDKRVVEEELDEDIMTGITPEKEWQFSMVLSDINMKLGLNNPRFGGF